MWAFIIIYQHPVISCEKRTMLMADVNNRGNWVRSICRLCTFNFFINLKLLQNKNKIVLTNTTVRDGMWFMTARIIACLDSTSS